jgi:hypothetical protein
MPSEITAKVIPAAILLPRKTQPETLEGLTNTSFKDVLSANLTTQTADISLKTNSLNIGNLKGSKETILFAENPKSIKPNNSYSNLENNSSPKEFLNPMNTQSTTQVQAMNQPVTQRPILVSHVPLQIEVTVSKNDQPQSNLAVTMIEGQNPQFDSNEGSLFTSHDHSESFTNQRSSKTTSILVDEHSIGPKKVNLGSETDFFKPTLEEI